MTAATVPTGLVLDEDGQPDPSERYEVSGSRGVAWRVTGWAQFFDADDDEWVDDVESGMVWAVMVGDDRPELVDTDDLVRLDPLAYCGECGQVGCTHDGRER